MASVLASLFRVASDASRNDADFVADKAAGELGQDPGIGNDADVAGACVDVAVQDEVDRHAQAHVVVVGRDAGRTREAGAAAGRNGLDDQIADAVAKFDEARRRDRQRADLVVAGRERARRRPR